MKKRILSALAFLFLGIAFISVAYFIGKTIENNKPALEPIVEEIQEVIKEEVDDAKQDETVKGEKTESKIRATRIIDGDTFVASTGETIRLIGVDAPERNDCYSVNAENRLSDLILNKEITIEYDKGEKDRYGRTLLYVWVDNVFVNEILAREGYADSKRYTPNIKYAPVFEAAEEAARSEKLGIWSNAPCE